MRYKVRAKNEATYRRVLRELKASKVALVSKSDRRRFVSTENLPDDVKNRISQLGGEVAEDRQYAAEASA